MYLHWVCSLRNFGWIYYLPNKTYQDRVSKLKTKKDKTEEVSHPCITCRAALYSWSLVWENICGFRKFPMNHKKWEIIFSETVIRAKILPFWTYSECLKLAVFSILSLFIHSSTQVLHTYLWNLLIMIWNASVNPKISPSIFSNAELEQGENSLLCTALTTVGMLQFPSSWYHNALPDDPFDGAMWSQGRQKHLDAHPGDNLYVRVVPKCVNPNVLWVRCK